MAPAWRFWVFLALAGLACLGIILGAASQREKALDVRGDPAIGDGNAAGNMVALTGLLVAVATGGAGWLLGRQPARRAWGSALVLTAAAYALVLLAQSAFPASFTLEQRQAMLAINPLLANHPGAGSVLLPVFAALLASLAAAGWALRRLAAVGPPRRTPDAVLGRHLAAAGIAGAFLLVAATGLVRSLLGMTPRTATLHAPFIAVAVAALVTLAVTGFLRTHQFAAFVRNRRLAGLVDTAWGRLARADAVALGSLVLAAGTYAALPSVEVTALQVGTTVVLMSRGHMLFLLLAVAAALVPQALVHLEAARMLARPPPGPTGLEHGDPRVAAHGAALLAAAAAAAATVAVAMAAPEGPGATALAGWLVVLLPLAALAAWRGDPWLGTVPLLLLAATAWGVGNTVTATFDVSQQTAMVYLRSPEILSLWRFMGAVVGAFALVRVARLAWHGLHSGGLAWSLTVGTGVLAGVVVLLELPFTAWVVFGSLQGESAGVGSVVAVQDPVVQATMHALALIAAVLAAAATARLHRPDWFRPRPRPLAAPATAAA